MKRDHKIVAARVHNHEDTRDCPDGPYCDHAFCVCGRPLQRVDFWSKPKDGGRGFVTVFWRHAPVQP